LSIILASFPVKFIYSPKSENFKSNWLPRDVNAAGAAVGLAKLGMKEHQKSFSSHSITHNTLHITFGIIERQANHTKIIQ